MKTRHSLFALSLWVVAISMSVAQIGCKDKSTDGGGGSAGTSAKGASPGSEAKSGTTYFADSVIKAWEDAGAKAGWVRSDLQGDLWFRVGTKEGYGGGLTLKDDIPAFEVEKWEAGKIPNLPAPGIDFALYLRSSQITDEGLAELSDLTNLKSICLDYTNIGDEGAKALAELTQLERLNMKRTNITDAGLKHLAQLTNLKTLNMEGVRLTRREVYKLENALSGCMVYRD